MRTNVNDPLLGCVLSLMPVLPVPQLLLLWLAVTKNNLNNALKSEVVLKQSSGKANGE